MTTPDDDPKPRLPAIRRGTLLLSNVTKLAGVAIVINESLLRTNLRPSALAVAAFMMAGAQVSESVVLGIVDRLVGRNGRQ